MIRCNGPIDAISRELADRACYPAPAVQFTYFDESGAPRTETIRTVVERRQRRDGRIVELRHLRGDWDSIVWSFVE